MTLALMISLAALGANARALCRTGSPKSTGGRVIDRSEDPELTRGRGADA
jgi:hypothetical protein